jgi:flagellar assembly protein FliH
MSLSRIVKKPSSIVFSDVVQIKEPSLNKKTVNHSSIEDLNISNQVIIDAQVEAQRVIDLAQEKIEQLKLEFEVSCQERELKTKQAAFNQGYGEGFLQAKKDLMNRFDSMVNTLENHVIERKQIELNQIEQLTNQTHLLALEIANKIVRQNIEIDSSILKPLLMEELETRKRQAIKVVEVSRNASELIQSIENELSQMGIDLHTIESDKNHLVIEGEMGRYDLSIDTQIKNIRRLFNTI